MSGNEQQYYPPQAPYVSPRHSSSREFEPRNGSPYNSVRSQSQARPPLNQEIYEPNGGGAGYPESLGSGRGGGGGGGGDGGGGMLYGGDTLGDQDLLGMSRIPAQMLMRTQRTISSTAMGTTTPQMWPFLLQQCGTLVSSTTLELYRANAKKTQDPDIQFEFAVFMIDASKSMPIPTPTPGNTLEVEKALDKRDDLVREATSLLKRLADRGHPPLNTSSPTASQRHRDRKEQARFRSRISFIRPSCEAQPPGCCIPRGNVLRERVGMPPRISQSSHILPQGRSLITPWGALSARIAELNGELGLSKRPKEGVKWLKRSAEHATAEFPHALHELALLHERGIDDVVFVDYEYSVELLAQAAELGYAPSAYRLGECYEYGKMGCPQDPALSIHYYNIAAQQNHRDACFALTAWYLVGSPGCSLNQTRKHSFGHRRQRKPACQSDVRRGLLPGSRHRHTCKSARVSLLCDPRKPANRRTVLLRGTSVPQSKEISVRPSA
ncbi:Protein SKT [Salix suchowensis]|nr:Protein SKT [Salix suchowensis]